jgi:exopolysaccharide biosynthesis polyprenyl glycosylphosphotransferase
MEPRGCHALPVGERMSAQVILGTESAGIATVSLRSPTVTAPVVIAPAEKTRSRGDALHAIGRVLLGSSPALWLAIDTAIIWLGVELGYDAFPMLVHAGHVTQATAAATLAGSLAICGLVFGLYERQTLASGWRVMTRVTLTALAASVLSYAFIYVVLYARLSRRAAAVAVLTYWLLGAAIRLCTCYAVHKAKQRLLIVGTHHACAALVDRLREKWLGPYDVVGYVFDEPDGAERRSSPAPDDAQLPFLGATRDVVSICRRMNVGDIVVCNGAAHSQTLMSWLLPCLRLGYRVTNEATFHEKAAGQVLVDEITPDWFLFADLRDGHDARITLKRVFDVLIAVLGLAASLPVYLLIAVAVKLEDGGPVFYSQDRVGKDGAIFKLYKFRTMRPDAENGRSVWAAPNDPRVTRVGRVLRQTRLDELPQFYNVLIGQMSVVGPRPERPEFVMELCRHIPFWSERNLVKPGITGWAQISFHYGSTVADAKRKLQFDLYYIKHLSLELDLTILFRTIGTFLRGAC